MYVFGFAQCTLDVNTVICCYQLLFDSWFSDYSLVVDKIYYWAYEFCCIKLFSAIHINT